MQLADFLKLSIGTVIYNKCDKDIRQTVTQFYPDRLEQYKGTGAVMWTRPLFAEEGPGRDIPFAECGDWEPLPLNVWEIDDQVVINRFIIEQQNYLIERFNGLRQSFGRVFS